MQLMCYTVSVADALAVDEHNTRKEQVITTGTHALYMSSHHWKTVSSVIPVVGLSNVQANGYVAQVRLLPRDYWIWIFVRQDLCPFRK